MTQYFLTHGVEVTPDIITQVVMKGYTGILKFIHDSVENKICDKRICDYCKDS